MADYYIKYIYGPRGQKYPNEKNLIHFAEGQEKSCEHFKNCLGFLLYETGSKENNKTGAKSIYAYGLISSKQQEYYASTQARGRRFSCAVKINLQKRVDPQDGISLGTIRKITKVKTLQRKGGLLSITEEQFDELCSELDKTRLKH